MRNKRLWIAPCRSGSTALFASVTQHPQIVGAYHEIKRGLRNGTKPDHSFFDNKPGTPGHILVGKESIGHSSVAECTLQVFPSDAAIAAVAPLFLFRDPVSTYNSWRKKGWGNLTLFVTAYGHTLKLFHHCRDVCDDVAAVSYEKLTQSRKIQFTAICKSLGIPFDPIMINWKDMPGESTRANWGGNFKSKLSPGGDHESLGRSSSFEAKPVDLIISADEVHQVEKLFRVPYEEICALAL